MNYYIILCDYATDKTCEANSNIYGLYADYGNARVEFNRLVDNEREGCEQSGWEIYEDTDTCFDAGENGYYLSNHLTYRLISKSLDD